MASQHKDETAAEGGAEQRGPHYEFPLFAVTVLAIALFIAEIVVTLLLSKVPHLNPVVEAVVSASLLFLIVVPLLYFSLINPLQCSIREQRLAHRTALKMVSNVESTRVRRAKVEQELRETAQRLDVITRAAADAIIQIDSEDSVIYWNDAAETMFGYSAEEIVGNTLHEYIIPPQDRKKHIEGIKRFRKTGSGPLRKQPFECSALRKDGTEFSIEAALSSVKVGDEWYGVGVVRDITNRKASEEKMEYLPCHDSLTGLPNRTLFLEHLMHAIARARRHGEMPTIFFIDLDQFKLINDTLGHRTGDTLLQGISERLKASIRQSDTLAYHSGDEFLLLVNDLKRVEEIKSVAEKVVSLFEAPFTCGEHTFAVTVSFGISVYPHDGEDAETLLKNADTALYEAKEDGRNTYRLYNATMYDKISRKVELEKRLRMALENEEFLLHYQPQVDAVTGEVDGVEALVRWQSTDEGLVSPGEFIPVAEASGLIVPLGEWILRTACLQSMMWQERGLQTVNMAVNISMRQFKDKGFVATVERILDETHLNPDRLELELTESIVMADVDATIETLHALKGMGIRLSIDDFGTGYSSLSYLKRMPINMLKVDQSFVRDITTDPNDAAIARATIEMARSMELEVIAEGVETVEQLKVLSDLQCRKIQGYLFSRPLPPHEIKRYLSREWRFAVEGMDLKGHLENVIAM